MLTAVGIGARLAFDGQCIIEVAPEEEQAARAQLRQYEAENRPPPPPPPPPRLYPHAWVGCALYVAVLTGERGTWYERPFCIAVLRQKIACIET